MWSRLTELCQFTDILNFTESRTLGYSNSYISNIYLHAKFVANNFIDDRDMAENPSTMAATTKATKTKSNASAAAILNFQRWLFRPPVTLVWSISICSPNLVQIDQEVAELRLFAYFQDGCCPPSWICYSRVLDYLRSLLHGLCLPCQRSNDLVWCDRHIATLHLRRFTDLVRKCLFAPLLGHNRGTGDPMLTQRLWKSIKKWDRKSA